MAYVSIVFGAFAILLLSVSIGLVIVPLCCVSIAAAIVGAILGVMSRATKAGKAGMILSLVSLVITVLGIAIFIPTFSLHPSVQTSTSEQAVAAPRAK
jgi:hypothetical protein